MQDAQEVMGVLVKVQNEQGQMEPDDPQVLLSSSCLQSIPIPIPFHPFPYSILLTSPHLFNSRCPI